MPYRYLEEIATADIAFEAWGTTQEELFIAAADALLGVMVEEPATVAPVVAVAIELAGEQLDLLLFAFLQELVYHKDARQLLLRITDIALSGTPARSSLTAVARGEEINPGKHTMIVDVKAVTLHRFLVEYREGCWRATVILDI
ncbi:protein archease [Geotalea uraniireducens]|uniref:Protein archease n=1 Tax=Geotalea uraniireducens TaxID=351604 RepID=A0ABM8ELJ0_9BACT|nr:archease [Geotalea uraniireducens]BDV43307.1 protein archease [Geotalea uraniireducens]